ncbi:hypothetical protein YC2023_000548 [Brassica napus]
MFSLTHGLNTVPTVLIVSTWCRNIHLLCKRLGDIDHEHIFSEDAIRVLGLAFEYHRPRKPLITLKDSPHRSKMVMKHVQGNLAQRIFARIWGFHPLPLPPMFSRVKQALAVSKIYGYCFTATFGGAGFLLGGVTTSPVSKGLRENEALFVEDLQRLEKMEARSWKWTTSLKEETK